MVGIEVTDEGDLRKELIAETIGAERAVTAGIRIAGAGLKGDWRGQVERAGLGARLARTIRCEVYPKGQTSISAAALVYTRAPKIIGTFQDGTLIRSSDGFWLAIPTPEAGKHGVVPGVLSGSTKKARITPGGWERRTGIRLRFVYRPNGASLLVADNVTVGKSGTARKSRSKTGKGATTTIIFWLVPQVKMPKRLFLGRAVREWRNRLPDLVVQNWPDVKAAEAERQVALMYGRGGGKG